MRTSYNTYKPVTILISLLVILSIALKPAESYPKYQTSDPNIIATLSVFQGDVFYVSETFFDLRVTDVLQASIVFITTIVSDQNVEVILEFEFIADIQGQPRLDVYRARTYPISLTAGQTYVYTNKSLRNELPLEYSEFVDLNDPNAKKIVEIIRATSKLPDGVYTIRQTISLAGSPADPYDIIERTITIINPTRVEGLSPIDETIFTTIPLFQWRSDTRRTSLHIYEWNPTTQTKEEAITGIPHLVMNFDDFQNLFVYPAAGARVLEPGKNYCWQVKGHYLESPATEATISSDIYCFRIADQATEATLSALLQLLESMLGPDYEHIFNEIREGGYEISDRIRWNGTSITIAEAITLINNIFAGVNNAQILDLQLEY